MGQSYKLRLGDGTVLFVDHAGLANWLSDGSALVQPAGAELWTPLRSFLIQDRAAARRAARHRSKPPSTSRDALPLVYPEPLEKPARGHSGAEDAVERHPGPPGEAKEPIRTRADGLPLVPPPPKRRDDPDGALRRTLPVSPPPVVPPPLPSPQAAVLLTPLPQAPCPAPAAPPTIPPAEESPTVGPDSAPSSQPAEEDVGWMTLPLPRGDERPGPLAIPWLDPAATSPAGAPPSRVEEAPPLTRSRARAALEALVSRWIESLARRTWRATRLWLTSQAAAACRTLVALRKSLGRSEHPWPSPSHGERAPRPGVDSERTAPLAPRPSLGAPPGERVPGEKSPASRGVYRPRRSPHDGLPLLQLDDEEEDGWVSSGGRGAPRSTDDLPELVLEPVDELPGRRPAALPRLEVVGDADESEPDAHRSVRNPGEGS
jgi:hypothetical protein